MALLTVPDPQTGACTQALRRVLPQVRDQVSAADLLFLERWEMYPLPGAAAALRVAQLRRANPELAAAIRAEVKNLKFA